MFNVEIISLDIRGCIVQQNGFIMNTHVLTGGVRLSDNAPDDSLLGRIVFDNGKPQLAQVSFQEPISINDVFAKILSPGLKRPVSWPTQFSRFLLSDAILYYSASKKAFNLEGQEFVPGYHLQARLFLFEQAFLVRVGLPESRKGVIVSGRYEGSVDLGFA